MTSNANMSAEEARSVFVIGDMIIDNTAFVYSSDEHPPPVPGEGSFKVIRRLATAGGAATTARAISVLGDTNVILWGLLGSSPWGDFRTILEHSQELDGCDKRIHLRGVSDDTNAAMTTINRLVAITQSGNGREHYRRHARFSDFGHLHIPEDRQVAELKYTLDHFQSKSPLDCVVINDVEFGTLHFGAVYCLKEFCAKHSVPLIARIRKDALKYQTTECRAIVCTLAEWCKLVKSPCDSAFWSRNLAKRELALDFIHISLATFRAADGFIILAGEEWVDSVIIIDRDSVDGKFHLSISTGLPAFDKGKSHQVGVSDVFVGAVLMGVMRPNTERAALLEGIDFAMNVVATYQSSRWHHIHRLRPDTSVYRRETKRINSVAGGARYLPLSSSIRLSDAATELKDIFTISASMHRAISKLVGDIRKEKRSIALTAPGGSGKSFIARRLTEIAVKEGYKVHFLEDMDADWNLTEPQQLVDRLSAICGKPTDGPFFIFVDEFLKLKGGNTVEKNGVILLKAAAEKNIRFFLIDADFQNSDSDGLRLQFGRRLDWHTLPCPWERPEDVPYIVASYLDSQIDVLSTKIFIEPEFFLALTEWVISQRRTFGELVELLRRLLRSRQTLRELKLSWEDLPVSVRARSRPQLKLQIPAYEVLR